MRKIRCLFQREWHRDDGPPALRDTAPGQDWVFDPHIPAVATEKYDGTSVLVDGEHVWRRRKLPTSDVKGGHTPTLWKPAQDGPSGDTWPGWVPVEEGRPEDEWHVRGFHNTVTVHGSVPHGTYELVGPKVQGNPYELDAHVLWRHGNHVLPIEPGYDELKAFLGEHRMEGVVFHELFGNRMAKITRRDFGITWP